MSAGRNSGHTMSAKAASGSCLLSARRHDTPVTAYAVPSDVQLVREGFMSDELARANRVQQQVQLRLAERRSSSHILQNGSQCSSPVEQSGTMGYNMCSPGFSSHSAIHKTGSRTMAMPIMTPSAAGYSSRSAVELGPRYRISQPPVSTGYHNDNNQLCGYSTSQATRSTRSTMSRSILQSDHEALSLDLGGPYTLSHKQHNPLTSLVAPDGLECHSYRGGGIPTSLRMRRSLSGTLAQAGGKGGREADLVYQHSFKGPAHRTISRINNRQYQHLGSETGLQMFASGGGMYSGEGQYQNLLRRATSLHSLKSVGKGFDVPDLGRNSAENLKMHCLDMPTAVRNLLMPDTAIQVLGAAYIQHQCYHSRDAKNEVRLLKGVPALVHLFNSASQEVQRYSTGATRNLIYENMDNKTALIEAGGIEKLLSALKEPDEELQKNITGILWNLSSNDSLKEKLARETLNELTQRVMVPLCSRGDFEMIYQSPSEADIFYNTTGCLRNLSSVNERTRKKMRDIQGLVDSLVAYIKNSLQDEKAEDKGIENAVCVLRNLSYQLYNEMDPSTLLQLEGCTRDRASSQVEAIGCFMPQSKKSKERQNQELSNFSGVAKQPKGSEWLWHPKVVGLYNRVLQHCETNTATREAAAGALQNITAGETQWASLLSWVILEKEQMLPVLLGLLKTHSALEMRSLTGLLRNISRHKRIKDEMATKVVNILLSKIPSDGHHKEPCSEVVVNICGTLNNLVAGSSLAARDITYFDGLPKLVAIKCSHDNSSGKLKAAKAASTVLCNMFQYHNLHKDYKKKGFTRENFTDTI
ncbi:hypothetical protein DPEC_G00255540 [Dallia pectoralis]|uniref:Uncharacterized protein n=1 Tax=Dallia pectoralis TaxID=75939 RepID=A0ACC2FUK6_DALPE|nr:hypothetical protein DPEC_G00255540 [Dallia pectoralis]